MTRILIIDDLNFIRQALQTLLEKEIDLEIADQVDNGAEAIEYLESNPELVDIIIADLEMPIMDGLTLTQTVSQRFPEIKVIIFSSHDDETNINAAIEAGAKGYISKNTSTTELINTIRNVQRGYFQLGPGLFEIAFSYLIREQRFTSDLLSQLEIQHQNNSSRLAEKHAQISMLNRQELFDELDFQMDNIKTEFRQGLEIFQERVNHQVQSGLKEMLEFADNSNPLGREIQKQVEDRNSEHHVYLKNLFITNRESVEKLQHQLCWLRYLVIFLGMVLFAEHLAVLIWR